MDDLEKVKAAMAKIKKKEQEAEWNRLIDDGIAILNARKGTVLIAPAEYEISENEYQQGVNHRVVTAGLIRQHAFAMGDPNPLWRDPNYAIKTRWGGIIAPPTFDTTIAYCSAAGRGPDGGLRFPYFSTMASGNRHEYFNVIRPGDDFHIVDKYLGCEEKPVKGKSYRMFIETGERTYINQRDEVVAVAQGRAFGIGTPPWEVVEEAAATSPMYQDRKRRKYTKEELDKVYKSYDEQLEGKWRRGNEVRYWDDVNAGDELNTLGKGPVDASDICTEMVFWMNIGFAIKWAVMRHELQQHPLDVETGGYRYRRDWHIDEAFARQMGMPYGFMDGAHLEMILTHIVTDWMGDDGFVRVLDYQVRRSNFIGEINWLKGKVVKKYIENGEHLVDLDVWIDNQDNLTICKGLATVKLISRA